MFWVWLEDFCNKHPHESQPLVNGSYYAAVFGKGVKPTSVKFVKKRFQMIAMKIRKMQKWDSSLNKKVGRVEET